MLLISFVLCASILLSCMCCVWLIQLISYFVSISSCWACLRDNRLMHHTVPAAGMQISPEMLKSISSMMSSMSPEMMQSMMSVASSSGAATGAASASGAPGVSGQQTAPGKLFIITSPGACRL